MPVWLKTVLTLGIPALIDYARPLWCSHPAGRRFTDSCDPDNPRRKCGVCIADLGPVRTR